MPVSCLAKRALSASLFVLLALAKAGRAAESGVMPQPDSRDRISDDLASGNWVLYDWDIYDWENGGGSTTLAGVSTTVAAKASSEAQSAAHSAAAANPARTRVRDQILVQATLDAATEMGERPAHVTRETMQQTAGTLGDPMRYFQTLPGVQTDSDQRNDFLVRGGNPSENLFVVDGIEVPSVNQFALSDTTGGLISMIDGEAIESMTLRAGAHDAGFSDRLSSVVEISTDGRSGGVAGRDPAGRGPAGTARRLAEVDVSGAGGLMSRTLGAGKDGTSVAEGRGSLLLSERQSVLSLFTHDIGIGGVPLYNNALARGDWTLTPRDRVWGISLTGIDSIAIKPDAGDLHGTTPLDVSYRGWRNATGANWQHVWNAKTFGVAMLANSEQVDSQFEYQPLLSAAATYQERMHEGQTSAKYEITSQVRPWLLLSGGGTGSLERINFRLDQPLPLDSPYSLTPATGSVAAVATAFSVSNQGGFAQATLRGASGPVRGARLTGGARVEHQGFDGATRVTPRAFLAIPLGGSRLAGFGYAEYAQMPAFLYLLAVPENHGLTPIRARHYTFDLSDLVRTNHVSLSLAAYEKRYADYPVSQQYPQLSLANIADTFGVSFPLFPMVSKGLGRTDGVEASFAAHGPHRLRLQVNTAYARCRFSGLDGIMRRGNFDTPLSGNASAIWEMGRSLVLAGRYSAASGKAFTYDDLVPSFAQNRDIYDLNRINGRRSSPYSRLDFRVERSKALHGGVLTWHLGLQNALNHRNFYALEWRPEIHGDYELDQMPTFPEAGAKWVF